ncbi:S24 family peptidase [Nitratireductor sp. PBL-C9]|uniref:S24 family peptidase n=2 Tax=Hyphomicrobiales TaxID=356 RepID=UPI003D7F0D40
MTAAQCLGAMLSRFRICLAASYPQPTSVANSAIVFHPSMRAEMDVGSCAMSISYNTYDLKSRHNRTPWTMNFGHSVRMEEPKDRLRQAMIDAGYNTPAEAARAFREINQNTLTSNLNGNRPISRKAAEKYARLFGTRAGWILFDEEAEEDRSDMDVPLLSMVSAGHLREQTAITTDDIERWVRVADMPKGEWIALTVEGDSMDRVAPDGAIVLVNRADDRLIDGRYYIFSHGNGAATFKRYRRNPERLQPYSTNPDHTSIPVNGDLYVFGRVRRIITDV